MTNDESRAARGGMARRRLLRGAAVAGAATVASGLVLPSAAAAGPAVRHSRTEIFGSEVETGHATREVVDLFLRYFTDKTRADVDATMAYFSRSKLTYIDAVLGWPWYSWAELRALFAQYMPTWPDTAKSYPTRILGDSRSAVVIFTDTPELFGHEIRPMGFVNFEDRRIVRWIDYWDGRDFTMAGINAQRTPLDKYPHDFKESTVEVTAAPAMRRAATALNAAFTRGDAAAAMPLFAEEAIFEDHTLHVTVLGRRRIEAHLTNLLHLMPYGPGAVVRHVAGSAVGGGYEWANTRVAARYGGTALELDNAGRITRLTTVWDGSRVDRNQLADLLGRTIRG